MVAIWFVALAAVGTLVRFVLAAQWNGPFPWATLAVNVVGAFVLGWLVAADVTSSAFTAIAVGGLGSLTTFSTVANESLTMTTEGRHRSAVTYVATTVVAGVAAALIGLELGG